jgi:hypothetical protein
MYNPVVKWNRITGIILLLMALVCLLISIWPVADHTIQIPFSISDEIAGKLELSNPDQMRVGDKTDIILRIVLDQDSQENQKLTLISKLELYNLEVTPRGEGKVTIDRSIPLVLKWKITPRTSGIFSGTLWLFAESNTGDRNLILARPIQLVAKTIFGVSYQMARIIGFIGLITAIFLIFFPIIRQKLRGLAYNLV